MRTTTLTSRSATLTYPNAVVFMHSPQPVVYKTTANQGKLLYLDVYNDATEKTYREKRRCPDPAEQGDEVTVEFDISRALQQLSPDIDTLLHGLDYSGCKSLGTEIGVQLRDNDLSVIHSFTVWALPGALDAGETYSSNRRVRLYPNWPQTVTVGRPGAGDTFSGTTVTAGAKSYTASGMTGPTSEAALVQLIRTQSGTTDLNKLLAGIDPGLQCYETIQEAGRLQYSGWAVRPFTVDTTPMTAGRYFLRWLSRSGGVRYWLFFGGDYKFAASAANSFTRRYTGDPNTPDNGCYRNEFKANMVAGRTLTLGAPAVTDEEFELLADLAVSPVVDLLTGMSLTTPTWTRVAVAAGTYTRNRRRANPNLQDFEITVTLPTLNCINL